MLSRYDRIDADIRPRDMSAFAENSNFEGVNSCQYGTATQSHDAGLDRVNVLAKDYGRNGNLLV